MTETKEREERQRELLLTLFSSPEGRVRLAEAFVPSMLRRIRIRRSKTLCRTSGFTSYRFDIEPFVAQRDWPGFAACFNDGITFFAENDGAVFSLRCIESGKGYYFFGTQFQDTPVRRTDEKTTRDC